MPLTTHHLGLVQVGDWTVDPANGTLRRGSDTVQLDDRPLRLLLCLVRQAGEVLSIETLLAQVWSDVVVTPDSVYQAVTALRRQLGDDSKHPLYIVTVPRRGYRLIATVSYPDMGPQVPAPPTQAKTASLRTLVLSAALLAASGIGALAWHASSSVAAPASAMQAQARSIAVLPFEDLTEDMNEEPFADGMAEELIARLSKVPGLSLAPPASSYMDKDKQLNAREAAKALHVAFVLDGSVRKSGHTLRVTARLTRASDGFVAWSETYDRTWGDKLKIQEDIASEAGKALVATLH
ncbi:MAG: winged helix-turn-helix domain-containing protein [Massilia sp.]